MNKNILFRVALGFAFLILSYSSGAILSRTASAAGLNTPATRAEKIEGNLDVIADHDESGEVLYFLNTDKERLRINFNGEPKEELLTGTRVSLDGVRNGEELAVDETSLVRLSAQPEAVLPNTLGEIKVLVLLVNFQDNQSQPYTTAQADDLLFNTANASSVTNYYREASYGQTWVTGNSYGWYTMPMNADCNADNLIPGYAQQAATAAGIDITAYNKFMYVFPNIGCSYSGMASVGGQNTWINGSLVLRTTAHELGHTLGLWHSKGLDCGDQIIGSTCTPVEYGHPADMLGGFNIIGHLHPYQKERLGWLNNGAAPPVTTVESSGTYVVTANSVQNSDSKALKILKSVDASGNKTWYYVEFRRPVGFDGFVGGNSSLMNGVLVTMNTESDGRYNYVLDMTPLTDIFVDGALQVGQSFADPDAGVNLTLLSAGRDGATLSITLTGLPCSAANPSVNINPSLMQQTAPGNALSYLLTVTNNNSSTCSGNNTFNILPSAPAGCSVVVTSPVLTIAPGASATALIQVAVPSGAADGFYTARMNVINQASPNFSASVPAGISVVRPVTCMANPTVTISPSATQWRRPASTVAYTVTVKNNNTSTCTSNSFAVQPSVPDGWTATLAAAVLNITPGRSVSTTVQVSIPAGAADNFYSVGIAAANTTSPAYAASTVGSIAVYSSLDVDISTDQSIYNRGQTATITANITALGTPMAGAAANFIITKPNGRSVSARVNTGANGAAIYKYKSANNDPIGIYTVSVAGSLNGVTGAGSITFEVR